MEFTPTHRRVLSVAVPAVAATALVVLGLNWSRTLLPAVSPISPDSLLGLLKLLVAGAIGLLVTTVQRYASEDRPIAQPMEQAQILLCIAGALVIMMVGDSLARAVGIMGGAAIVRFRTPVDDPKDATVLFLLLGLGMAAGMGHFGVAGLGALFLCAILVAFSSYGGKQQKFRSLTLQVVWSGPALAAERVESVLNRFAASYEAREISNGDRPAIRYHVSIDSSIPLASLSSELLGDRESAIQSLTWDVPKKERYL
ncbi:MAG: hypothetical protein ACRD8O_04705 [Bryobacteraceae bacterium]